MKAVSLPWAFALLLLATACGDETPGTESTVRKTRAFLVDEGRCRTCHLREWRDWKGSHHELAMQEAREDTVLADFDDTSFTKDGVTSRFFRRDGGFFVETDGPDGTPQEYEVLHAFGVHPLQQYLVDVGGGRIQVLATCWDVEEERWFHLYDEPIVHDDPLHWTGRFQNWNYMCAECHVTGYDKGYDPTTNTFDSTWHALGVGCQECHGPGSAHVAWAERVGETVAPVAEDDPKGLVVDLKGEASVQVDTCARCHARRDVVHAPFEHGTPFLDHYEPELLVEPLYFPDGQILDEVYVYGSFVQAKKHAQGVRCTDCHDPHTAGLKHDGNATCTQCHAPEAPERFPVLAERAKAYDDPSHHRHEPGSPGSACVDCHMPATTYMQVDPRRDHGFKVPRPDLTVSIGVPNACTGCHEAEGAAWAAEHVAAWHPEATRERRAIRTFAEVFAEARRGEADAVFDLIALADDAEAAPIVRATALRELRRHGHPSVLEAAARHVEDEAPLVRLAALDLLQALIPSTAPRAYVDRKIRLVAPALTDPLRALRVEAARTLAGVGEDRLPATFRRAYADALTEFRDRQRVLADRPEAWLNLGGLEEAIGDDAAAEAAYRKALAITPDFIPVRFNLANLLNRRGANAEAERLLREVIDLMPEHGEAHYSLGLLLAEVDRYGEAASLLSHAADLMPGRPRIHYNRALVLQRLGRLPEAVQGLERAHELAPRDPEVVHALVLLHLARGEKAAARRWAERLARLVPDEPGVRRLLEATR